MYRPEAMSALGPEYKADVLELMDNAVGLARQRAAKNGGEFVVQWRKHSGLLYYEREVSGRLAIKRNGVKVTATTYATVAGARGRIAWEAKREKERKLNAA